MSERDAILGRIREALKISAPVPGTHDHHAPAAGNLRDFSKWLPQVGAGFEELAELFRANSIELKTDFRLLDSAADVVVALEELKIGNGWQRLISHRGTLTDAALAKIGLPVLITDDGYDVNAMEACDAGITECDSLVAQTGTVVITNRSAGGRALSVLPPHHVVIARREQLIPDLPTAFALLKKKYEDNYPSMISLVTGPSRTGDIERILVLGAHGPKKLTVLCY